MEITNIERYKKPYNDSYIVELTFSNGWFVALEYTIYRSDSVYSNEHLVPHYERYTIDEYIRDVISKIKTKNDAILYLKDTNKQLREYCKFILNGCDWAMLCEKHSEYNGKEKPDNDCLECWKIYVNKLENKLRKYET